MDAEACAGVSTAEEAAGHEPPQSRAACDTAAELVPPLNAHCMPAGAIVSYPFTCALGDFRLSLILRQGHNSLLSAYAYALISSFAL